MEVCLCIEARSLTEKDILLTVYFSKLAAAVEGLLTAKSVCLDVLEAICVPHHQIKVWVLVNRCTDC